MAKKEYLIVIKESRHGNRMLQVEKSLWEDVKARAANRGLRKAWQGFRELKENETVEVKTSVGYITIGKNKQKTKKGKEQLGANTEGELNND